MKDEPRIRRYAGDVVREAEGLDRALARLEEAQAGGQEAAGGISGARRDLEALRGAYLLKLRNTSGPLDERDARLYIQELRETLAGLRASLPRRPAQEGAPKPGDALHLTQPHNLRAYVHALWDRLIAVEDATVRLEAALAGRAARVGAPTAVAPLGPWQGPLFVASIPAKAPAAVFIPVRGGYGWVLWVVAALLFLLLLLFLLWPRSQALAVQNGAAPAPVVPAAAPTATATAAPADTAFPRSMPTPTAAPVVRTVCSNTDVPAFPGATLLPAESAAVKDLLTRDMTLSAERTEWKFDGADAGFILGARVFLTEAPSHEIVDYFRRRMEGTKWIISLHQPEFGYLEGACNWDSRKFVIGTFQDADLSPVQVQMPGYVLIVYND
jgi:hypothetical protein